MYKILINNDDTVNHVERQRIMEKSKLVNELQFIVPKFYNNINMEDSSFLMQYKLPSGTLKLDTLKLINNNYENNYLLYTLPIDTNITSEAGKVEINLSFVFTEMNPEGEVINRSRKISPTTLTIIPISNWFVVPDEALDTLTQYYLANQQSIKALEDLVTLVNQKKADNIELSHEDGEIRLTSEGKKIGEGISLNDLGDELAEKTQEGLIKVFT